MQRITISRHVIGGAAALIFGILAMAGTASAQEERSSQVSVQGTGLFTLERSDDGDVYDATNSGGFLVGYTYRFNDWAGVEANYGYSRNTHNYLTSTLSGGVQSNLHQFTGAFVARGPEIGARLRPYALTGGGALLFDPTDEVTVTFPDRQARPAFLYGGGVEVDVTSMIGVRGEYRGFVFETPDFDVEAFDLGQVTHQAQPSVGVYFRF